MMNLDEKHAGQFEYLGRWVNKNNFRAFVYSSNNDQILAKSYQEFESLLASGLWFACKKEKKASPEESTDAIRATSETVRKGRISNS